MDLPYQWAEWEVLARRVRGFIEWVEPAPEDMQEERYALCIDVGLRWARVSPCPGFPVEMSQGCFYGATAAEAMQAAREAAAKQKVKALVS